MAQLEDGALAVGIIVDELERYDRKTSSDYYFEEGGRAQGVDGGPSGRAQAQNRRAGSGVDACNLHRVLYRLFLVSGVARYIFGPLPKRW